MRNTFFAALIVTIATTLLGVDAARAQTGADTTRPAATRDTDGDGLLDTEDSCPTQVGPADRGGCPPPGAEMLARPIVSQTIPFSAGGTVVSSEAKKALRKLSNAIRKTGGNVLIVVEGHADSGGPMAYNDQISAARARVVVDYLTSHGVPAARMTVKGRGSRQPIADNGTPEGRAKNRRAEVRVYTSLY